MACGAAAPGSSGGGAAGGPPSPASSVDFAQAAPATSTTSSSSSSNGNGAASTSGSSGSTLARTSSHGGRGASEATMEEQERELRAVTSDLPRAEARLETLALWVGAAVAFGGGVWYAEGAEKAQEFFAGYILEQSLSVDNLFVFVLVFGYFKTPLEYQPKVLNYGIATAAALRAVMILLGTELVQRFEPVLLLFALVLLWSAYGLLVGDDDDDEDDLSNNNVRWPDDDDGAVCALRLLSPAVCAAALHRAPVNTKLNTAPQHNNTSNNTTDDYKQHRSSSSAAACCR